MTKESAVITLFSSFQWLLFIFVNTVVVPISVGAAFELPSEVIEMTIRYSFIITGAASIFQAWMGHRYPILDSHSGLMWGLMLNLGISASALGMDFARVGGGIATGVLLAGFVLIFLATFDLISIVQKVITPMVRSVYTFLLTFHLTFVFFKGMFKVNGNGTLDLPVSFLSIGVVVFVIYLMLKGSKRIANFAILIGMVTGWLLYGILFPAHLSAEGVQSAKFVIFPFGSPNLELGIILVSFFGVLLNLTNTFVSIKAAAEIYKENVHHLQFRKSIFITGVFTFISAVFGLVPYTPFTSTIGFLESTKLLKKNPFFISGVMFMALGIIPPLAGFLGTIPLTVGNAVLFVAYLPLFGTSLNTLKGTLFNSYTIYRLAVPVLIGVSIMNIPPEQFGSVPVLFQPLISNGFMVGVIISIFLENFVNWGKITAKLEIGQ